MAFSFDSALVQFAAAIFTWVLAAKARASARLYLRFAAVLMAALAAAMMVPAPGLAFMVALISASLAGTGLALALCFPRRPPLWFSSVALALSLAAGLTACLLPLPILAPACQTLACCAILVTVFSRAGENPRRAILAGLGATAFFLGGMTVMDGTLAEANLFFAVALALLARASQLPVADQRVRASFVIGRKPA